MKIFGIGTDIVNIKRMQKILRINNNNFIQSLSNVTQVNIIKPKNIETTSLGAAYLAGLQAGIIKNTQQIEKLWKMEFKKPVSRLKDNSNFIRSGFHGQIYWAAIGEKTTKLAAENADGVIFFLKPRAQILDHIDMINSTLLSLNKSKDTFNLISIIPTYLDVDSNQAKMTLAGYIGANEFYSTPLSNAGFQDDVKKIKNAYENDGLKKAAQNVENTLLDELTIIGSVDTCKEKINEIVKNTKLKTIILGFDMPKDKYTDDFFAKLDKLLKCLQ